MRSSDSDETVWEQSENRLFRLGKRVALRLPKAPDSLPLPTALIALAFVVVLLLIPPARHQHATRAAPSSTPSPRPTTPAGHGPFVVWANTSDNSTAKLYAADVSRLSPGDFPAQTAVPIPILVGELPGSFSADLTGWLNGSVVPVSTGQGSTNLEPYLLSRQGLIPLDAGIATVSQVVVSPDGRSVSFLVELDQADYIMQVTDLAGDKGPVRINFRLPAQLLPPQANPPYVPSIVAWSPAAGSWVLGMTNGQYDSYAYKLNQLGVLTKMPEITNSTGVSSGDGNTLILLEQARGCGTASALCPEHVYAEDLRTGVRRLVVSSPDIIDSPLPSPDGALIAYGRPGGRLEVASMKSGHSLGNTAFESEVSPLAWTDSTHFIAGARATDLSSQAEGSGSAALIYVSLTHSDRPGITFDLNIQLVATGGGEDVGFVGWLR